VTAQPASRPDEVHMLELLIQMTLDDELRKALHDVKTAALNNVGSGEDPTDALKRAVEQELAERGWQGLTCARLETIVSAYTDRIMLGVDYWRSQDQEQWKNLRNQVTDLASSDY